MDTGPGQTKRGIFMDIKTYEFTVPGILVGQQRARSTKSGRHYTPKETVNMQAWIRGCASDQIGQVFLTQPVQMEVMVTMVIPESWSQKKQRDALLGLILPTKKPDFDNMLKTIADALTGIAWKDDAQVVRSWLQKDFGLVPETLVRIWAVPGARCC